MGTSTSLIINPFASRNKPAAPKPPKEPKPPRTITSAVREELDGVRAAMLLPLAKADIPVPYVIGRQLIAEPNVIWYGNLRNIYEIEKSTKSETSTDENGNIVVVEKTTVIYNIVGYEVSAQFGLCLGPDVRLLSIKSNDKIVWEGVTAPGRDTITIDDPEAYMRGNVHFNDGAFDQTPDPFLAGVIGADTPGYVGTAHIVFERCRTMDMGGPLFFEVRRVPNPLGLSDLTNQSGDDVNVATAMVDILTNDWGGVGVSIDKVDVDAFIDAAETFANEGQFCSLISREVTDATELLDVLQEQTQSIIFANPFTGKITIKLLRKNLFNVGTAPRFNPLSVVQNNGFRNFAKNGWPSTVEQLTVSYTDRDNNYTAALVSNQSLASLSTGTGRGKRVASIDYPTVFSQELAQSLLERDFARLMEPNFSAVLETNQTHRDRLPGDLCVLNFPDLKLYSVPCYVTKVRRQPITTGTVVIEVRKLPIRDAVPVIAPPPTPYNPDLDPRSHPPVIDSGELTTFREAPFWMVKRKGTISKFSSAKTLIKEQYALLTPAPANASQMYFVAWVDRGGGIGYKWAIPSGGPQVFKLPGIYLISKEGMANYPGFGELENDIYWSDALANGIIPSVILKNVVSDRVLGGGDDITGSERVRQGISFVLIHDEIFAFEEATSLGGGRYELLNVHRALLDTVPQTHGENSPVYIVDSSYSYIADAVPFSPTAGVDVHWKFDSLVQIRSEGFNTPAMGTDAYEWHPTKNRTGSPLRPHDTKIDGVRSALEQYLYIGESHTITWRTRNRDTNTVTSQLDDAEPGELVNGYHQVHRVIIIDSDDNEVDCGATSSSADANTLNIIVPAMETGSGWLFVQSEMQIGGETFVSQYRDKLPVYVLAAPPRITENGDIRVTEDGGMRLIE